MPVSSSTASSISEARPRWFPPRPPVKAESLKGMFESDRADEERRRFEFYTSAARETGGEGAAISPAG